MNAPVTMIPTQQKQKKWCAKTTTHMDVKKKQKIRIIVYLIIIMAMDIVMEDTLLCVLVVNSGSFYSVPVVAAAIHHSLL